MEPPSATVAGRAGGVSMIRGKAKRDRWGVRLLVLLCVGLATLAVSQPAHAALPSSIAALGDSLIRGWGSDGTPTDAYAYSWATGTDLSVNSHYRRLLARTPAISGQTENYAYLGATMANVAGQTAGPITAGARYVTIMAGTNDVCTTTVGGMTTVASFSSALNSALSNLTASLPTARILVGSIPDWYGLWQQLHLNPAAANAWATYNRCPDLLGSSTTARRPRSGRPEDRSS